MIRPNRYLVISVAVAILLCACSKKEEKENTVVVVQMAAAQKTTLEQTITTEAILFPKNQAAITPKISAPVKRFFVNRGSKVKQGQLLAILENRDVAASVTENRGNLEQAQAAYETTTKASLPEDVAKAELDAKAAREALDAQQKLYDSRQDLYKQGALPRKDLDQAAVALVQAKEASQLADQHLASTQAVSKQQSQKSAAGQLTSAQGKYAGAAAQLSYTEIRSPISGVVTDRPNWQGETPATGSPILTIMDTASVVARAHVPQEQAAQLKIGDEATLAGEQPVKGKVTIVSPALDAGSTTVEVWAEFPNKQQFLRAGSTVQLQITARKIENVVAVPAEAIIKTDKGTNAVMVVGKDHKATQTEVETGVHSGGLVQVTKGLDAGQIVVTTGAYGLPDGTQVKTSEESQGEKKSDKPEGEAQKEKE